MNRLNLNDDYIERTSKIYNPVAYVEKAVNSHLLRKEIKYYIKDLI